MLRSVPQMPTDSTCTKTSPGSGCGSSVSCNSIRRGPVRRAAFRCPPCDVVVTVDSPAAGNGASYKVSLACLSLGHQHELAGGGATLEQPVGLVGAFERKASVDAHVEVAVRDHRHHGIGAFEELISGRDVVDETRSCDEHRAGRLEPREIQRGHWAARLTEEDEAASPRERPEAVLEGVASHRIEDARAPLPPVCADTDAFRSSF